MKIALWLVIESDHNNINKEFGYSNTHKNGLYEQECIKCVANWRKHGGWLKDIDIIVYSPTKNTPSIETIDTLLEFDIIYIENYIPETETYRSGFWNIPLVGKIIEKNMEYDFLIHIDLDMNLINPLDKSWFKPNMTIVGQYDEVSAQTQRKLPPSWDLPLDTGFVISHSNTKFYEYFYNELQQLTITNGDDTWRKYCSDISLNFLEEYAVDKLYNTRTIVIQPIKFYQIGEWYTEVDALSNDELKNVRFIHEHIQYDKENYDPILTRLRYKRRKLEWQ